ncbi:Holliday junction resolvase RuvX [Candidatus Peregrinibacteria bacterium]|nr:Holliday junction resolvase RuvX [Candidatus Peregrinibacteria bacterium]
MRVLALDIGTRRTGVAFAECPPGIPLLLPTVHHKSVGDFLDQLAQIINMRHVDHIVVGLPLLSSGKEGKQAQRVRALLPLLTLSGARVSTLDERYSTERNALHDDSDAVAAWKILTVFIDRLGAQSS